MQSRACREQKVGEGKTLTLCLSWGVIFSCPWTPAVLILRPSEPDSLTSLAFLGLQLADGRLWSFLFFITLWANSCNVSSYIHLFMYSFGLPRWLSGKEPAWQCRGRRRHGFNLWVGKIPWKRKWQPTPVFLPEKFHGQKSLAHYSPWGLKEWDTTEHKYPVGSVTLRGLTNTKSHIKSLRNKRGRFPFLHFFSHFLT